ncbi:hypothetical protein EJ05DRAFT_473752, partial [Pseudovirgaria hyperparasitica]
MNSLKNAGNYLSSKVQAGGRATSKEANKQVAKDPNAPITTRISAAKDAVGDKLHESKHKGNASAYKQGI